MSTLIKSLNKGLKSQRMASSTGLYGPIPDLEFNFKKGIISRRILGGELPISNYLRVSRTSAAHYFKSSDDISMLRVEANIPRIGYDHRTKRYGLIVEPSRFNFMHSVDDTTFDEPNIGSPYAIYGLGGRLIVKPRSGVSIIRGDGSLESPMLFNHDGNSIEIIKVGEPYHGAIELLRGNSSPSTTPFNFREATLGESVEILGIHHGQSFVVNFTENPIDANMGQAEGRSYLYIKQNEKYIRIRRQRDTGRFNIFQSLYRNINIQHEPIISTIAITFGSSSTSIAINGELISGLQPFSAGLININLGSFIRGFAENFSGLVAGLAIYQRELSFEELIKSSRSWL